MSLKIVYPTSPHDDIEQSPCESVHNVHSWEVAMADAKIEPAGEITQLLRTYADGAKGSFGELIPLVYRELKTIARAQLRRSGGAAHMQTTMLVHEAYEKLLKGQTQNVKDRRHFYAIASRAMRQIAVDTYRSEGAAKRGGGVAPAALLTNDLVDLNAPDAMLHFDQVMQKLAAENEDLAEVVDLSCFGGLSNSEIADLTGSNVRTIQRKLARAQAWIGKFLRDAQS